MKTLKARFNANQITVLTKNQIELFFKNIKFIVLTSTFIILSLVINIFGFLIINNHFGYINPGHKITYINLLIVATSIFLIIQTIYLTVSCFISQIKNNVHTAELRYGYKVKNIYLSRLFFVLGVSFLALLIMFVISSIFFAIGKSQDGYQAIYLYRLYISSFAWYGSLIFFSIVVTIILSRFLPESATSIVATTLMILFLLFPIISSFVNNIWYYTDDISTRDLIAEDYYRKLINDVETGDETFKNLYSDFEAVYKQRQNSTYLILGPKMWDLSDSENNQIENYNNFYQSIAGILQNGSQITSWDAIPETSWDSNITEKEPIGKLIQKLRTNQVMQKYSYLLNFVDKYTKNFNILTWSYILHSLSYYGYSEIEKIQTTFSSSDEYYFIKTLNTLLYAIAERKNETTLSRSYTPDEIKTLNKLINKNRIMNIFNPLNHFNLMFNSIDYHNEFLFNVAFEQDEVFFYGVTSNVRFTGNLNDLNQSFKLKRIVPVETIYLFYWVLGAGLIWLSYLRFNKKIKK